MSQQRYSVVQASTGACKEHGAQSSKVDKILSELLERLHCAHSRLDHRRLFRTAQRQAM